MHVKPAARLTREFTFDDDGTHRAFRAGKVLPPGPMAEAAIMTGAGEPVAPSEAPAPKATPAKTKAPAKPKAARKA